MSSTPPAPARRRPSTLKLLFWLLLLPALLIAGYFALVLNWNYSTGERAGWVQKLSKRGWLCKTWEGEMAMVTMPGAIPEKFAFTVWNDKVAAEINAVMGKRVTLHYEQKVGLPTTCFGDTRHIVTAVSRVEEIPLVPGVVVPAAPTTTPAPQPSPAQTPAPQPAPAPEPAPTPKIPAPPATPPLSGY